jgi:hypothetical protein
MVAGLRLQSLKRPSLVISVRSLRMMHGANRASQTGGAVTDIIF